MNAIVVPDSGIGDTIWEDPEHVQNGGKSEFAGAADITQNIIDSFVNLLQDESTFYKACNVR